MTYAEERLDRDGVKKGERGNEYLPKHQNIFDLLVVK